MARRLARPRDQEDTIGTSLPASLPIAEHANERRLARRDSLSLFVVGWVILLVLGEYVSLRLKVTGDEPWYLLQSYAFLHGHGFNLAPVLRDHALYTQLLGHAPDDHTADYLGNGERVLVNMPGYAVAIAPFYLIGGRALVIAFQALVAALTGMLVFGEARRLFQSRAVALFTWLAYLVPLPVLLYAGQIFPSTLATGVTFLGYVLAIRYLPQSQGRNLLGLSLLIGALALALPWLHIKYTLVALVLCGTALVMLRPRLRWSAGSGRDITAWSAAAAVAGLMAASFLLIGLYSHAYFGTWTPPNARQQPDLLHPHWALVAQLYGQMLLDPRTGLLPWVPLDLLAIPGLWLLLRWHPRQGRVLVAFLVAQLGAFVTAAISPVFQGYALIGRFTLECAPFFALCVGAVFAAGLSRRVGRAYRDRHVSRLVLATGLVLLSATVWFSIVGEFDPRLLYPAATVRLVTRYPALLPGLWFALFPQV
jgi:hypothetical protein